MFFFYSLLLTLAFIIMLPLFLLRRQKYAAGLRQRLGNYPEFTHDSRKVIWLHCVSVGETNAARPLVDGLKTNFPDHRLIMSTTTLTGQTLAQDIFKDKADAVFYFPFDWKFSVRKALAIYKPSIVLLMETEIWPRFIREAKKSGAKIAIVNGRLSGTSFKRYSIFKSFIRNVLADVIIAIMQGESDAKRIATLGIDRAKVAVAGNLKFDHAIENAESSLTEEFRRRFGVTNASPFVVAASTHPPEEGVVLGALEVSGRDFRILIAPRHPERFAEVAELIENLGYSMVRRSHPESEIDKTAQVILLDSIGELRAVYPLADIVFVGGSLIPHGGQSVLEPAAAGKAIITGPFTHNFDEAVKEFLDNGALIQVHEATPKFQIVDQLCEVFTELLENEKKRQTIGKNALSVMTANRGATAKTIEYLQSILKARNN